ncbi:MAG: dehydrogenase E1 component subunit alpha/beta [Bacteroidia bacterium]|nr:dehydrogenase E1 component subunit alpha/beta [Bacteroidia bacterium]MCX7764462.1 dehydrogenase E1 component subunit alpha/beta [Bacteroidia bacterium]MDW8057056.1 dehydrogenase E1 component subunit alpha/beta [Bacteroidia bacterium]
MSTLPIAKSVFHYDPKGLTPEMLLRLYREMLYARLIEEKMLSLLRQGKVSKWFSGIGQEAIAVGATLALRPEDYIFPLHRNLGVFTSRGMPLRKLFAQWQGKASGFTRGRERSFHFGAPEYRVIGMISHLGAMLPVADGVALASNLEGESYIALAFIGDGGTSEGDFHEALNVASVWKLPVLFLIENNGYGLSTPVSEQYACERLALRAVGYGIEGYTIEGNNVLEVYHTIRDLAEKAREDRRPRLIEAVTFRMRGHEEASGTKYVPPHLFKEWEQRDPILNYERFLLSEGLLSEKEVQALRRDLKKKIEEEIRPVLSEPEPTPEPAEVYAPFEEELVPPPAEPGKRTLRFVDAISEGLRQAMQRDPKLILMGQDIAEYGGVFKVTEGFVNLFGKERVRNTPLCESAILGMSLGLALRNFSSMVEMQFADFVSYGFTQIVNNLAKNYYRWGVAPKVVVRLPTGAGVGAGPFHSQSLEGIFLHVPGLKIVYPSTAYDAKGLLTTALRDPNPVLFFEHKALYRSIQDVVPESYYNLPLGVARVARPGKDLSIITYGMGVVEALKVAEKLSPEVDIEVIDLRTLLPWDKETVAASVRRTHRVLVLYEGTYTAGVGAEIAAWIGEYLFEQLDAPVMRLASKDTPVPFSIPLEKDFLPWGRLPEAIQKLLAY